MRWLTIFTSPLTCSLTSQMYFLRVSMHVRNVSGRKHPPPPAHRKNTAGLQDYNHHSDYDNTTIGTWYLHFHTLSLRRALAPALMRDCVVATSPASAAKKSAVQPVLCGERASIKIRGQVYMYISIYTYVQWNTLY